MFGIIKITNETLRSIKSQGKTLRQVGLYLHEPVFCHGQLYVALSRVTSASGIKILIDHNKKTRCN